MYYTVKCVRKHSFLTYCLFHVIIVVKCGRHPQWCLPHFFVCCIKKNHLKKADAIVAHYDLVKTFPVNTMKTYGHITAQHHYSSLHGRYKHESGHVPTARDFTRSIPHMGVSSSFHRIESASKNAYSVHFSPCIYVFSFPSLYSASPCSANIATE